MPEAVYDVARISKGGRSSGGSGNSNRPALRITRRPPFAVDVLLGSSTELTEIRTPAGVHSAGEPRISYSTTAVHRDRVTLIKGTGGLAPGSLALPGTLQSVVAGSVTASRSIGPAPASGCGTISEEPRGSSAPPHAAPIANASVARRMSDTLDTCLGYRSAPFPDRPPFGVLGH